MVAVRRPGSYLETRPKAEAITPMLCLVPSGAELSGLIRPRPGFTIPQEPLVIEAGLNPSIRFGSFVQRTDGLVVWRAVADGLIVDEAAVPGFLRTLPGVADAAMTVLAYRQSPKLRSGPNRIAPADWTMTVHVEADVVVALSYELAVDGPLTDAQLERMSWDALGRPLPIRGQESYNCGRSRWCQLPGPDPECRPRMDAERLHSLALVAGTLGRLPSVGGKMRVAGYQVDCYCAVHLPPTVFAALDGSGQAWTLGLNRERWASRHTPETRQLVAAQVAHVILAEGDAAVVGANDHELRWMSDELARLWVTGEGEPCS